MANINIVQIGAGGTGAWAARGLAYGLCNMRALSEHNINWRIFDPDTVEEKNQLRQLFIGADVVGEYKVDYTVKVLQQIFAGYENFYGEVISVDVSGVVDLVDNPEDLEELSPIVNNTSTENLITIIFLAVDNTYTRSKFEQFFDENRKNIISKRRRGSKGTSHAPYVY